jgi:uncharacterized cupredoxin-like copper-binding protein
VPVPRHLVIASITVVLSAGGLAACGGDDSTSTTSDSGSASKSTSTSGSAGSYRSTPAPASGGGGGQSVKLAATESGGLSFDKKQLTAKAGSVTLVMDNPSANSSSHAIAVEGKGVDEDGKIVAPGGTSKVTADLKPGTYTFYCPVPGHEAAGMKGTLTVE